MVDSVRVGTFNDLTTLSPEALTLYRRERWERLTIMANERNRQEAKRAMHQYIDALEEQDRRERK